MDLTTFTNQLNDAGQSFFGSVYWSLITAFLAVVILALLAEVILKTINRIR